MILLALEAALEASEKATATKVWQLVLLIFAQLASEFALDNVGGGQDVERRVFGLDGLVWHGNDHLYLIFIAMR